MTNQDKLRSSISISEDFVFGEVSPKPNQLVTVPPPSLGPLAAFVGEWSGSGFNTIFRPDSPTTPTVLPIPAPPGNDNILELNLTSESLSFSPSLGSIPNRGMVQADAFLNGIPYLQSIQDVTNPAQPVGIHVEPGLWVIVPPTTNPAEGQTLVRMASIPHGTTIQAQGTSTSFSGPPTIPPVSITPFFTVGGAPNPFASQTLLTQGTPRIPQDLTTFNAAGTITQNILDDPNTVLRNVINGQNITATTEISIATNPASPLFGGGADNIAFLLGNNNPFPTNVPNAQTLNMTATFWIETVEVTILVPIFPVLGQPPLTIRGIPKVLGQPVPKFSVTPPTVIREPRRITFTFTQIQYSQTVMLNFNTLTWPHVSVATLVPADTIVVPPTVWD